MNSVKQTLQVDDMNTQLEGYLCGDDVRQLPETGQSPQILFQCPVCHSNYSMRYDAVTCSKKLFDRGGLTVGDLLIIPGTRTSWEVEKGLEHWIAFKIGADSEENSHHEHVDHYHLWWVVTAMHSCFRNPHRCVVTVATLGYDNVYARWNPANGDGHHAMYHYNRPIEEQFGYTGSTWWDMSRNGKTYGQRIMEAQPSALLVEQAKELSDLGISSSNLLR